MLLVITHPAQIPGETALWRQLLAAGADALLLRKPGWQQADYRRLLEQAHPDCYPQLMISQHAGLCREFGLKGIHLGEQARLQACSGQLADWERQGWRLSTAVHDATAIPVIGNCWTQLLLSPVFDSISKPGYRGRFRQGFRLNKQGSKAKVLALGGVDHTNAALARGMGFDGIALLGAIWQHPANAIDNFHRIQEIWNANAHT